MHIFTVFHLLLLPLLAIAQDLNYCAGDKSVIGYCNVTTFTDQTAFISDAPTTSQCQDTCRGVLGDAGEWLVNFSGEPVGYVHSMVQYPCAFSVGRDAGEPLDYGFPMHNQDIIDILDEVNKRYGDRHGGKVAAQGTMVCNDRKAVWYMN